METENPFVRVVYRKEPREQPGFFWSMVDKYLVTIFPEEKPPLRYVILDLETTGLSPKNDRIIEFGAVAIEDGRVMEEFHSLVDAGVKIPYEARRIHGITNKMLKGQPKIEEVVPHFHKFIANSIVVAHNADFDLSFLKYEFSRQSLRIPNVRYLCTLYIFRRACPKFKNHKFATVARIVLGNPNVEVKMHRALEDARLLGRVWLDIEERLKASSTFKYLLEPSQVYGWVE